jgi:hypothetical protein
MAEGSIVVESTADSPEAGLAAVTVRATGCGLTGSVVQAVMAGSSASPMSNALNLVQIDIKTPMVLLRGA